MLDVGLDVPVSAELHSVFQIDIRVVRNLGKAGLSGLVVAFLHKAQFLDIFPFTLIIHIISMTFETLYSNLKSQM